MWRYSFQKRMKRIAVLGTPVTVDFAKTGIYGGLGIRIRFEKKLKTNTFRGVKASHR